jgi:hypothetical protein
MIDCTKKNFIEFCERKELQHTPQLEFILYGNSFKYYHEFSDDHFEEWITNIFDKEANERKSNKI